MEGMEPDRSIASDRLVRRIVDRVGAAEGVHPLDLSTPLYDAIDPVALERILASNTTTHVRFEYMEWMVEVRDDGTVALSEASNDA